MNKNSRTEPTRRIKHWEWLIFILLILVSLSCYVRTLAPGLLCGDSAEFQTLAHTPGMTHPTGYAVYLLIGW